MNYRTLDRLFELRDERSIDTEFEIKITLLEIYNETIRDMLRTPGSEPEKLAVKENKDGSMYVPGLTEKPVNSRDEVRSQWPRRVEGRGGGGAPPPPQLNCNFASQARLHPLPA